MLKALDEIKVSDIEESRFWSKVRKGGEGECWEWVGAKRRDGYGVMKVGWKLVKAHRIAWMLYSGKEIGDNVVIDHDDVRCRNKGCVNPGHLSAVTQRENVRRWHQVKPGAGYCRRGHEREVGKACLECNRERQAEWKARHPERYREIQRKYDARKAQELREWREWSMRERCKEQAGGGDVCVS